MSTYEHQKLFHYRPGSVDLTLSFPLGLHSDFGIRISFGLWHSVIRHLRRPFAQTCINLHKFADYLSRGKRHAPPCRQPASPNSAKLQQTQPTDRAKARRDQRAVNRTHPQTTFFHHSNTPILHHSILRMGGKNFPVTNHQSHSSRLAHLGNLSKRPSTLPLEHLGVSGTLGKTAQKARQYWRWNTWEHFSRSPAGKPRGTALP